MDTMKLKNELPRLETMVKGKMWALNVHPEAQYWDEVDRLDKFVRLMKKLLNSMYIEYQVNVEISPYGRLHVHGYVWIHDPFKFYLHDVHRLLERATVVIKPIDNFDTWDDYATKQCHQVRTRIERFYPKLTDDKKQTSIDDYYVDI